MKFTGSLGLGYRSSISLILFENKIETEGAEQHRILADRQRITRA